MLTLLFRTVMLTLSGGLFFKTYRGCLRKFFPVAQRLAHTRFGGAFQFGKRSSMKSCTQNPPT